ncbi:hypothetical protein B0J18DRAFT_439211 [Chaetomium sp. MPI-SDFR-AT-0129]|nr:hypothetical protein B0J18DRAFT_439211 [Chaetomium sp. MPI-SDFR-AT-0129]
MAGTVHETFVKKQERLVIRLLDIIGHSNDQLAAEFARDIDPAGSPTTGNDDGGSHCPDGSFGQKNARAHCVILEVSHSQQGRYLPFLAEEDILGSNGRTQVVIGIDLESRSGEGKEARVVV